MDSTIRRQNILARSGLDPTSARAALVASGLLGESDDLTSVRDIVEVVAQAADPDQALRTLGDMAVDQPDLFAAIRAEPAWLQRVVAVAGASRPLGDLLARLPDPVEALRTLDPVTADGVAAAVHAALAASPPDPAAAVAAIRRRCTADIAARDLTGAATVDEVARELSALAEGVLTGALAALHREIAPENNVRLAVIGMGKLGGCELNYVSDVDVIFVHEAVAGANEEAAATEANEVLGRLLTLLNTSTTMGRTYEVDPTLRPEGRSGALSRTPASYRAYWERWAKTWEFQAMLKGRPVAGDLALAQELLAIAQPFVFPDELAPTVVDEIRRMKARVEAKPEVRRHGDRQVKLGPGGLRDIEFAVQLLQLVHGRADVDLRRTGTLPALEALAAGGYVADADANTFARAYRMLRRVEHRLQLARERRTHTLPESDDDLETLARTLGYRAEGQRPARTMFLRDLRATQAEVRELHAKLFYRPLLEAHAAIPAAEAEVSRVAGIDDAAARERFVALGFRDGQTALRDVRAMTAGLSRKASTLRAVLPVFLHELAHTADPNGGLRGFRDLVEAQGITSSLLARMRDHPPTVTSLARVLGSSPVAAGLLLANPHAVEDLDPKELRSRRLQADDMVAQARGRRSWQDASPALRRLKRRVLLGTVARDILLDPPVTMTSGDLTAMADGLLVVGLEAAMDIVAARHDTDAEGLGVRIAVVAMGRLAARELHYPSDLDVVFVHAPLRDDESARAMAQEVAETLMTGLSKVTAEGTAFEVDADLRPEGRNGPLSRSLPSFEAYWDRWAKPWEFQALMRTRVVAGDHDLGHAFREALEPRAWPATFSEADATAMRTMKARMESERIRQRTDPKRHIKLGPGGLTDVEWTVQMLQRRHAHRHLAMRSASTMAALDAAQDVGLVDHGDAVWLRDGYNFLSRLRNWLYLSGLRNVDVLPSAARVLTPLAHRLGYGPNRRQELEDDVLRHMRHVRQVTEKLFYGA